jgi:shikimate kinase
LRELVAARYPVYAQAALTIQSRDVPHEKIVDEILDALGVALGLADAQPGSPAQHHESAS